MYSSTTSHWSRNGVLLLLAAILALFAAACGGETGAPEGADEVAAGDEASEPAPETEAEPTPEEVLDAVIAGDWRGEDAARDGARHPKETLTFFGLQPGMTVIEVWPGGGWYTKILAPYLARTEGRYVAAGFDPASDSEYVQKAIARFRQAYIDHPETYGTIETATLGPDSDELAPPGTVDMILTFRNVHNWMSNGFAEKAFADFYAALRPGGVLGVVEHRASEDAESGYVRQDYVIAMAEAAGFELIDASEINANPADAGDHPFGVWTLPPTLRSAEYGQDPDPSYDSAAYEAIGESDRMTLKFRKSDSETEE